MIKHWIHPRERDLGGFSVRRLLPHGECPMVGPWIFFDHLGPAHFSPGKGIDVRPHPHIHLATVTYLFEGEIFHRDSLGSQQVIVPGDINLMVAGRGITHSERERPLVRHLPHTLHALQLWHALPEAFEETDPAFYHYPSQSLPRAEVGESTLRVMIGSAYGLDSPVKTFTETLYGEADIKANGCLSLPDATQLALYVVKGSLEVQGHTVPQHTMVVFDDHAKGEVRAKEPTRIAFIGGAPMSHRYIEWNFVSSRPQSIEKAKEDWRQGRFPKVPGDEEEFIPLPQ